MTADVESQLARIWRHGIEWKDLLSAQIRKVKVLHDLHRIEQEECRANLSRYEHVAGIIEKQTMEIRQLHIDNQLEHALLKERQFREVNPFS